MFQCRFRFARFFSAPSRRRSLAVPALAEVKVGVVDYGRLLKESPQVKVLSDQLDAEFNPRYQQLVTQDRALKTKAEKLQKDAPTMTADQRSKAEKELRDSARELERKGKELKDDSEAKRQEEFSKVQRMLENEIREYAKAQKFDIVLMDGVIYATPAVNITDSGAGRAAGASGQARARDRRDLAAQASRQALIRRTAEAQARAAAMTVTLGDLAVRFGCELRGDPSATVDSVGSLSQAGPRAVTFLANPKYVAQLRDTRAGAVILDAKSAGQSPVAALVAGNPHATYARVATLLHPEPPLHPGIHASACVAASARVDAGSEVSAHAFVGERARIGARCFIGPGCVIEADAVRRRRYAARRRSVPRPQVVDGRALHRAARRGDRRRRLRLRSREGHLGQGAADRLRSPSAMTSRSARTPPSTAARSATP